MANDDMYVVMYRILAYIYDCMKKGSEPSADAYSAEKLGIPQDYWNHIMNELVNHGYLCGVSVHAMFGGSLVVSESRPRVTMEGVAFIEEKLHDGQGQGVSQGGQGRRSVRLMSAWYNVTWLS